LQTETITGDPGGVETQISTNVSGGSARFRARHRFVPGDVPPQPQSVIENVSVMVEVAVAATVGGGNVVVEGEGIDV